MLFRKAKWDNITVPVTLQSTRFYTPRISRKSSYLYTPKMSTSDRETQEDVITPRPSLLVPPRQQITYPTVHPMRNTFGWASFSESENEMDMDEEMSGDDFYIRRSNSAVTVSPRQLHIGSSSYRQRDTHFTRSRLQRSTRRQTFEMTSHLREELFCQVTADVNLVIMAQKLELQELIQELTKTKDEIELGKVTLQALWDGVRSNPPRTGESEGGSRD